MNEKATTIAESALGTELREKYPLHFAVFENDLQGLRAELSSKNNDKSFLNLLDIYGRTPVMLSTMLGHLECAELLLENGADANTQNREMWSLSHEAIPWKNHNFLKKILTYRDYQRAIHTTTILQELNKSLQDTSDFFVEMNWEFTSWLPFVKNMCPSDTYRIYKCGTNVRIDANMLEIGRAENAADARQQSFIFRFVNDTIAEIVFIDPNEHIAYVQTLDLQSEPRVEDFIPEDSVVADKFSSPITTTYVDVENVGFERSTKSSGFFSWIGSSDKEEEIEGFTCRVMNASNVEIVTKTRLDHLSLEEREEAEKDSSNNKALSLLMSLFEKKRVSNSSRENASNSTADSAAVEDVYGGISVYEYLSKKVENSRIGKGREEQIKSNAFNANLWLSETFPLRLHEQIFPVIDLMAVRNAKFSRLKSFIQLQLPSGFPIRTKIPIFHLINAQITFRNVNEPSRECIEQCADVSEEGEGVPQTLHLRQSLFQIPDGFERRELSGSLLFNRFEETERTQTGAMDARYNAVDVEDEYVYLLSRFVGSDSQRTTSSYEQQMRRAIEESLSANPNQSAVVQQTDQSSEVDGDLLTALELSKAEEERRQKEWEEEEESLRKALELSILDK
uniref:ANK_REP_REGION domain-containing protein n=1 Tax=Globodera rostochiensis TaxID=31243 RepID=A0A914HBI9_GLORO